ncbi:hypothetical protein PN36_32130 [Candidatus Thiomargarita nelsonii]|uniref:Uncharacterized protein n=1 Tax=Candidatus Thiomargarita nelsonii TaxID=1003181 RepID=A0A4E0QYG1_9GAMM|nr:hypothetical protein PN36_32130 [Candidatus Thiomargarita nelsonii]
MSYRILFPRGGEYIFYAAVTVPDTIDIIGEIVQTSLIFASEPVEVTFGETRLPDGVIGRTYRFAIEPETGTPPFSLSSGSLPDGLTLGGETGLIQGEPSVRGVAQLTVQVVDAGGNVGEFEGVIKVFGVLSFGEHGTSLVFDLSLLKYNPCSYCFFDFATPLINYTVSR